MALKNRKRRKERKAARLERKTIKKDKRTNRRNLRRQQRQAPRMARINNRHIKQMEMIESGMNPNAWASDLLNTGKNILGGITGRLPQQIQDFIPDQNPIQFTGGFTGNQGVYNPPTDEFVTPLQRSTEEQSNSNPLQPLIDMITSVLDSVANIFKPQS